MAAGPNRRDPWPAAWLRAIPFSRSLRGTRLGISAWDAGIIAALAEPFTNASSTSAQTGAMSAITSTPSTMLWAVLIANIAATTTRLSNLSER